MREERVFAAPDSEPVDRPAKRRGSRVQGFQRVEETRGALDINNARHVALIIILRLVLDALHLFRRSMHVLAAGLRH